MIGSRFVAHNPILVGRSADASHHVLGGTALHCRPARKGSNPGVAGADSATFGRQAGVRTAGSKNDPMLVVAGLGREFEGTIKRSCRLQFNHVTASCATQGFLYGITLFKPPDFSGRWRVGDCAFYISSRQFGRTVKVARTLRGCRSRGHAAQNKSCKQW